MALVVLKVPDLSLLADPVATRVPLPHMVAAPLAVRFDGTAVRFAGDDLPTAFVGEGRAVSRQLTLLYGSAEQQQLAQLLELLETARTHPDPRLLFRTHIGAVSNLDPVMAVIVLGYDSTPMPGLVTSVALTVQSVAWEGWD